MKFENEDLEKPNRNSLFDEFSQVAYDYLIEQQEIIKKKYNIHQYENWFYDQETGILTFSNNQDNIVEFYYEEVGSISKISNTWLWSWANPHLEEKIKTDINAVKIFGENNNYQLLTKRKWLADDYDGWEMTAVSAYLLKAIGAYRIPLENTFTFVVYKEVVS